MNYLNTLKLLGAAQHDALNLFWLVLLKLSQFIVLAAIPWFLYSTWEVIALIKQRTFQFMSESTNVSLM